MRGCLQHDENDCGLACILTICKFLKISVDEKSLRKNIFLGNEGLSLYGITRVFSNIGIESLAVEGTNTELFALLAEEKKPIVIMINEDNECHYVVIYKENTKEVFLWDPNKGKRIVSKEYFNLIWSGYAVYITEVLEYEKRVVLGQSVCWSTLLQQKRCLVALMIFSIILIAVSMSTTFMYKNIIEQIEMGIQVLTPQLEGLFILMGVCYLLITILFIVKGTLIAYLKKELEVTLQDRFVKSLLNISIQKKDDYTSGGILDRYQRLSVVVETMSSVFTSVVIECISLIAGIIILASINVAMFGMVLIIVVSYVVLFIASKKKFFKLSKTIMDKESLLITHIKETIENLISLKSFENSKYKNKIENEIKFVKNQEYILNIISINMEGILDAIVLLIT
ncbi:MAG: cysteine peptidase family C39 domain-containing protein [Bacteroidales bacterium]|nr:cysteine peptidase family C39 domain-containing protein [Bacteroidales bacterium]